MTEGPEHALEVEAADVAAVLDGGIRLRCRCGWEHHQPAPAAANREVRRDPTGPRAMALIYATSSAADDAYREHLGLDRG